jgi:hypothetical protein
MNLKLVLYSLFTPCQTSFQAENIVMYRNNVCWHWHTGELTEMKSLYLQEQCLVAHWCIIRTRTGNTWHLIQQPRPFPSTGLLGRRRCCSLPKFFPYCVRILRFRYIVDSLGKQRFQMSKDSGTGFLSTLHFINTSLQT